jgi:hypothetical protein
MPGPQKVPRACTLPAFRAAEYATLRSSAFIRSGRTIYLRCSLRQRHIEHPLRRILMALPETTSKMSGPLVKQFSVFLANKVGAMLDIVKLLSTRNAHVVALSISESTDSAIARIVVSDPETAENIFHEHDVAFGVCEMVVVELQEVATELPKLLAALLMAEVNMHFSYPLLTRPHGRAALALHVDDTECACSVLQGEGFKILSQADISR